MVHENDRLALIFIWKQAAIPDVEYARQVLGVANPDALRVLAGDNPPVRFFGVFDPWPADPWTRALADMRSVPTPDGSQWSDSTRYDLAGWQGTDQRTGQQVFVVSAYRKANAPALEAFQGAPTPAPAYNPPTTAVPQVPYHPQHPTGPIDWPPQGRVQAQGITSGASGPLAQTPPRPLPLAPEATSAAPMYGLSYGPPTGPLPGAPATHPSSASPASSSAPASQAEPIHDSYTPYFVGFGPRTAAGLIDFFFMSLFQVATVLTFVLLAGSADPQDLGSWLTTYGGFFCLAIFIFSAYHVTQWAIWGQTLGQNLLGMKVVDAGGNKPQFGRALLRMLGYFFSFSIGGIGGFLLIVFDQRRQGLHDKIAETYVVPEHPQVPAPPGLPGYRTTPTDSSTATQGTAAVTSLPTAPTMGMAAVAGPQTYEMVNIAPGDAARRGESQDRGYRGMSSIDRGLQTVALLPELPDDTPPEEIAVLPGISDHPGRAPDAVQQQAARRTDRVATVERAREHFRRGLEQMEAGVRENERSYKVESAYARQAAQSFHEAVELVPSSVAYRYYYGVALRYAEGFEVAIREFRHVLELDPSHYEARQQVAYGQRWHDAFAYPPWISPSPVEVGALLPDPELALLPPGSDPVTRLVLLREASTKLVAVLSRTPRSAWARPLTTEMPARIDLVLSRTPSGPIIALYVVVEDKPDDPYKGETFLNPHDPGHPAYDACQLGQNLLAQLARQDRTYLIFVDEDNRLLLSRKLLFDPHTQVSIARCLYEVQTLPVQIMEPQRFQQAAEWHMEHFSLDQIK